jgi:hypothetical protein
VAIPTNPPKPKRKRLMVLSAPERFGHFYDNAMGTNYLLQHGVAGVPHHRSLFARWGSQLKKYHLLALWSFVRLHQIQGLMNLRQVLEAAVDAAFAIAPPGQYRGLRARRRAWRAGNAAIPQEKEIRLVSKALQGRVGQHQTLKEAINEYGAHGSVVQTMNNFQVQLERPEPFFGTSFFDVEDDYHVNRFVARRQYRSVRA